MHAKLPSALETLTLARAFDYVSNFECASHEGSGKAMQCAAWSEDSRLAYAISATL